MIEIWKDIVGYEGKYQVSNLGRIKSLNYRHAGKEQILKAVRNSKGYLQVKLYKDGKVKHYAVHRLVSEAFIQFVPEDKVSYEVDHRNTVRTDNRACNLCFVTSSQNKLNPKTRERNINNPKKSKQVIGINKVSGLIMYYESAREAERAIGVNLSNIVQCCKGNRKSAGGYFWQYIE